MALHPQPAAPALNRHHAAIKKGLAPFLNQRITVYARISCFGKTPDGCTRIAVEDVTYGGQLIADHAWIPLPEALAHVHLYVGLWLQFEARVYRYFKRCNPNLFHYGLDDIRAAQLVNEGRE